LLNSENEPPEHGNHIWQRIQEVLSQNKQRNKQTYADHDQMRGVWSIEAQEVGPSHCFGWSFDAGRVPSLEARFVAAQQNDARALFLEGHMARLGEELALIDMKINEERANL
jgi:hypothetical protein